MTILSLFYVTPIIASSIYPNISYLSNTSVVANPSIWGNAKQVAALQQNYYDKIRNYDLLDNRYDSQYNYYQQFSGRSQSFQDLYSSFRKTQIQPYADNSRRSEANGDISTPVAYTSVVASSVMGNPVRTNLGDTHFTQSINISNSTASSSIEDHSFKLGLDVNAQSSTDPGTAYVNNTEFARGTLRSDLVYGASGQITYGSTTGKGEASISHPLFDHASVVLDKSWCSNSVVLVEASCKLGYQITF